MNSFEQFCINFANERLQYYFNQHIFKLEQDEYIKEGISWSNIDAADNQTTIDLISKRPLGLLGLLDEESNFPKSTDSTFLQKCHTNHAENTSYIKPKTQKPYFGIKHYAGEVNYLVDGFLEKNRDTLRQDWLEVLQSSSHELIKKWFEPEPEFMPAGPGVKTSGNLQIPGGKTADITTMKRKTGKGLTTGYQFSVTF